MKIFISYNHKDQPVALNIKDKLVENGFDIIIDVEAARDSDKMHTGQDIEEFILTCIRESGVTLSLISANSLLSALVVLETVVSNTDEKLRDRFIVPCYIDKDFLDRNFTGIALEKIEKELKEIESLMKTSFDKGWGIEDLQNERTRRMRLKSNLPEIIGKFRNSLCIDLTPGNFETGMQTIINYLRNKAAGTTDASVSIKAQTNSALNELQKMIGNTLNELAKQRLDDLSRRLLQLRELLDRYEQELDFETEPKRKMRYEKEIETIKISIQNTLNEIISLKDQNN